MCCVLFAVCGYVCIRCALFVVCCMLCAVALSVGCCLVYDVRCLSLVAWFALLIIGWLVCVV